MKIKVYIPDEIDCETGEILKDSKVEEWEVDCLIPKQKKRRKSHGNKNKCTGQGKNTASFI